MSKRVPASGSLSARLVLIGEAPAKNELRLMRPFVGPSGFTLDRWWAAAGLGRSHFWIDNVFPYRAPHDKIKNVDRGEVEDWADHLHARLAKLRDPWLISPTGNLALRALLRKPLWHKNSPKISDLRGSILSYEFSDGRTCKMIPTIHPAATFKQPSLAKLCRADWKRIASEYQTREIVLPNRFHMVPPLLRDDINFFKDHSQEGDRILAIDIETNPEARRILCVGFSMDPGESITLPWPEYYADIKALCESPCQKVLQNGHYDTFWLAEEGVKVHNWVWDTLAMHHALSPDMPHDLSTMASLYTRQPFWKRDHKDEDVMRQMDLSQIDALYRYCGVDAAVTRELYDVFRTMLGR